MANIMQARHDGLCWKCFENITAGEPVKWDTNTKMRLIHADCKEQEKELPTPEAQDELERAFMRGEYYPDPVA